MTIVTKYNFINQTLKFCFPGPRRYREFAHHSSNKAKMRAILMLLTVACSMNVLGQKKTFFPTLTSVSIDTTYDVTFGYDRKSTRLINLPCYLLNKKDPLRCEKNEEPVEWKLVAKFRSQNIKDSLSIVYSEGMSADPGFVISTTSSKIIGRFSCTGFYINSAGTIYTSGHVNNMYDRRRKFQIQKDTVIEVKQPFNYVGLKGKALRDFVLYQDKTGNETIAQIPKGYDVEVLLADAATNDFDIDYKFLVKTDFGLVGWLRIEDLASQVIEGLYYAGD